MIESIKTALASWLRAEVFALVGEAMTGHDEDRADMLTEIEALKRENRNLHNDVANMHDDVVGARRIADALKGQVETLGNKLADANDHMPSSQQVADCISVSDLRKALSGADLSSGLKSALEDALETMDLTDEIKEAMERAVGDETDEIAKAVVRNSDFMSKMLTAAVKMLSEGSRL